MEICNLLEREWKNLSHRRCTGTGITVYAREQGNVTMKVYKMNCCSSWTKWTILNKPKQNDKLWLYSPAVTRKKSLFLSSNNSCGKHLTNSVLNFDAFSNVKVQNLLHFQLFNIQLWYRFPATLFLAGDFYYLNSQWFSDGVMYCSVFLQVVLVNTRHQTEHIWCLPLFSMYSFNTTESAAVYNELNY